jgi:hypothetical protein
MGTPTAPPATDRPRSCANDSVRRRNTLANTAAASGSAYKQMTECAWNRSALSAANVSQRRWPFTNPSNDASHHGRSIAAVNSATAPRISQSSNVYGAIMNNTPASQLRARETASARHSR